MKPSMSRSVLDNERDAVMARGFDEYLRKTLKVWEITDCISRFLGLLFIAMEPVEGIQSKLESTPSAMLPNPVRKDVLAPIEIGDIDEALGILDEVDDQNAARPLRDLAKKYRFETLKDLLSQEPPC